MSAPYDKNSFLASAAFPDEKDMRWRFSDLDFWSAKNIRRWVLPENPPAPGAKDAEIFIAADAYKPACACVRYENSSLSVEGELPEGVQLRPFRELSEEEKSAFAENFENEGAYGELFRLESAANPEGVVLDIAENARASVHIDARFAGPGMRAFALCVNARRGSDARVSLSEALCNSAFMLGAALFKLEGGARLNLCALELSGENSPSFKMRRALLGAGAYLRFSASQAGEGRSREDFGVKLESAGSEALFTKILSCKNAARHDLHTSQLHAGGGAKSTVKIGAILSDSSEADFIGEIFVAEGAQKTKAYQSCRALQLSAEARLQACPVLEISANDVECSHGCAAAGPDEDELFYMRARGLDSAMARAIMLEGFAKSYLCEDADEAFVAHILSRLNA